MTETPKPLPEISAETRPYWDGLAAGRLLLQRCTGCGAIRHYPRPLCPACHSFEHDWVEAAGTATVHSWTVAHHPFHPAWRGAPPFTLVTADLPEGVRILAPLHGAGPEALRIGAPLRIGIEDNGQGLCLPVLHPA
ncbi:MAG: OB-fold domain-containing protein [Acetobacteraceae bacterium]|nr:OB-fold domain-containing protein [Acetobacteraceae bacterium]